MATPPPKLFPAPRIGSQVTSAEQLGSAVIHGEHFAQVRNTIEIPWDDSVDATHPLDCFFQIPANTIAVRRAQLWVERKSFRAYETAASSGGSATSGASSSDSSASGGGSTSAQMGNMVNAATGGATPSTDTTSGLQTASTEVVGHGFHFHGVGNHSHTVNDHAHIYVGNHDHAISAHTHGITHTHTTPDHTHGITYGIYEQASTANFSVDAADDGTTYVAVQASTAPPISALDLTSVITKAQGDKRVRINATGLARCQVLLLLDLVVGVAPGGAG